MLFIYLLLLISRKYKIVCLNFIISHWWSVDAKLEWDFKKYIILLAILQSILTVIKY